MVLLALDHWAISHELGLSQSIDTIIRTTHEEIRGLGRLRRNNPNVDSVYKKRLKSLFVFWG
jgi:hypothetical protein